MILDGWGIAKNKDVSAIDQANTPFIDSLYKKYPHAKVKLVELQKELHELAEKKHIQLKDIAPYGLILPPRRLTTWRMVDRIFQQHGVPFSVVLEVGGWEVIKRYVELDFGISITTGICLRKKDPLVVRNMSRYFPKRSYGIVERQGKHSSLAARAFLEGINDVPMPDLPYMKELATP